MKIGFFITARLKSSRLKQKILLDLNGMSVIERVIERCKATVGVDGVVLCTSTNPQDSVLYNFALKNNIQFYAGSEDDVLQRLLDAANFYHYDAFLSITADNPLFSIYTSQLLVDKFKKDPFDFGFTRGLPVGLSTSLIETKALAVAVHMKNHSDTEIWGPFVNRSDFFNIFSLNIENSFFKDSLRLTLDYLEDYYLIKNIYDNFGKYDIISIHSLYRYLKDNPSILEINMMRFQKYPTKSELEIINSLFDQNMKEGLLYAMQIGKNLCSNFCEETISVF